MASHSTPPGHHPGADEHGAGQGRGHHVVVPVPVYLTVFAWLMVLLVITLAAAAFDLGPWNLPIAMTIAVVKAVLVFLFFMHLRWSSHLVRFFAGAALIWLIIMFVLTLSDYLSRSWKTVPHL